MSKYEQLQELRRLEKEEPEKAYKPGFWEQTPTRRHVRGEVTQLGESAEHYFSLGGRLDYQPSELSPFAPSVPTGERGTAIFRPPTLAEMTPEQRFETTVSEVRLGETQKEFQTRVEKAEFQYEKEMLMMTLPSTAAKGVGFGVLSALAPPVAATIAGVGFAGMGMRWEETKGTFKRHPTESLYQVGAGLLGVGVGAVGTAWAVPKITGAFRTIGQKPLAQESLMESGIISGEKIFPTAPTGTHLKLFEKSPYKLPGETRLGVWKAAPSPWAQDKQQF